MLKNISSNREKFVNNPFDVSSFSETHLDNTINDAEIQFEGFSVERRDRNRRGGGVAVYVSNAIAYKRKYDFEHPDIECLWIELKITNMNPILIGTYYRPPKSDTRYHECMVDSIALATHTGLECYLLGDLNFYMFTKRESRMV